MKIIRIVIKEQRTWEIGYINCSEGDNVAASQSYPIGDKKYLIDRLLNI